jgi:hypothetical protein
MFRHSEVPALWKLLRPGLGDELANDLGGWPMKGVHQRLQFPLEITHPI